MEDEMDIAELKKAIRKELPVLIREDPSLREYILNLTGMLYADKQNTEDRFWEVLSEMKRDREEQSRKWAEARAESERKWEQQNRKWEEQNRKWEEQNRKWAEAKAESERKWEEAKAESERKWEEQNRKWNENQKGINKMLADMKQQQVKHDSSIGALGARWGLCSEQSFRNALKAILEESFGVKVLNVTEYDDAGEVFGRPDQVELDVIIFNQTLILCEIKSNISRADVHVFDRKTAFYEKHHNRKATRRMVISPMVDPSAMELAKKLGIEVYSHSYDVPAR